MAKRGRPFEPGNKFGRGRPPRSRNKKTLLIEEFLTENSQSLVSVALKKAKQGNVPMLRLLLAPILPRPKDAPVTIGTFPMGTPEEVLRAQAKVMEDVAEGHLTPNQAEQMFSLMDSYRRVLESENLKRRFLTGGANFPYGGGWQSAAIDLDELAINQARLAINQAKLTSKKEDRV